jgi:hypothetical protein
MQNRNGFIGTVIRLRMQVALKIVAKSVITAKRDGK